MNPGFAHTWDMPAQLNDTATKGNRCFSTHDWVGRGRTNVIGALLFGVLMAVSTFQTNVNRKIFTPNSVTPRFDAEVASQRPTALSS